MKKFFSKLFGVIKQGWFLSLLGVIVLSMTLYYVAPLINDKYSLPIRFGGIVALVFIWLIVQIIVLLRHRRENEAVLNSLQHVEAVDELQVEVDEELDTLKDKLSDALEELKKNRLGKRSGKAKFLYQVPWYILIGPPASGKTTLLKNSSLKTALSKKFGRDSISGIGGTRHCDWWFAEQAVLLDTAGRYTTQDSHKEKDAKAWEGFLELLKENRIRRPINGVIVVISLDELLLSQDLELHGKEIRERVQELYERFSLNLPVYLVFTKADLMSGFNEFFDDLDKNSRAQVWGTTFTSNNKVIEKPLELLPKELDLLEDTLKDKLLHKLERETDSERRKKIYAFPEQFASIKHSVNQFVQEVFSHSRYQHEVMLRGVYFSSAEQTGSPIDKLLSNLAHTFGFEQAPLGLSRSRGRSYFIDDLLQKVIFPESELAGLNPAYERRKQWIQWGAITAASIVTLVSFGLLLTSYLKNKADVQAVEANTRNLEKQLVEYKDDNSLSASIKVLNKVATLYHQEDEGVMRTLGLDQREKLQHQTKNTYRKALHSRLLPHVLNLLEDGLQSNAQDTSKLLEYLKGYLILAPRHDKSYQDNRSLLKNLIVSASGKKYKQDLSPPEFQQLYLHLDNLFEVKPSLTWVSLELDNKLIEDARNILGGRNISELIYAQVKQQISSDSTLKEYVISGRGANVIHADRVFERKSNQPLTSGIPGIFTYKGYKAFNGQSKKLVNEYMTDNWILGKQENDDSDIVYKEVINLYLEDYQDKWDRYLAELKIKTPATLEEAIELLDQMSHTNSPVSGLLRSVADETYLSKPLGPKGAEKRGAGALSRLAQRKGGYFVSEAINILGVETIGKLSESKGDDLVSQHFESLRKLSDKSSPDLTNIGKVLEALRIKIQDLQESLPDDDTQAIKKQIKKQLNNLKAITGRQPKPLQSWLYEIRRSIEYLLEGNLDKTLNTKWKSSVQRIFQDKINHKFPLSSGSSTSIASGDFSQFFGPGGTMETFFNDYIAPKVDRSSKPWKAVSFLSSPISNKAIQQFQRAETIRNSFFPDGGRTPNMQFRIEVVDLSEDIQKVILDIDGSKLNYSQGGANKPSGMKWPGPNGSGYISLKLMTKDNQPLDFSARGEWALVDLFMKQAIFKKKSGSTSTATFSKGTSSITFLISATTSDNLLTAVSELKKFRCPSSLTE